jgi:hypothetical protein
VNPRVLRGVGYGLDEKALEAVAQWKFRPGAKDGKPVTVAATIEVNFRLLKNSDIAPPTTAPVVDPQLNANLVKLFELSGDRESIERTLPQVLKDAGAKMRQVLPGSDPAYFEEWAKRMASRLNVQDLMDEEVHVYERHFTNDEIAELLAVQVARKESKPAEVSTQLRQK